MLPDGFQWKRRWQYDTGDNAVYCRGKVVAYLDQRSDGAWFARLGDRQYRHCTSRESGRAGCEEWVRRHETHLRAMASDYESNMPTRPWMPR